LPQGERHILPGNEADRPVGRFSGQHGERGEVANLDGTAVVCLAAIRGISKLLGMRFYQALGYLPIHDLEQNRFDRVIALLWDSNRLSSLESICPLSLFTGIPAKFLKEIMG